MLNQIQLWFPGHQMSHCCFDLFQEILNLNGWNIEKMEGHASDMATLFTEYQTAGEIYLGHFTWDFIFHNGSP